jgi:hypothetical protein
VEAVFGAVLLELEEAAFSHPEIAKAIVSSRAAEPIYKIARAASSVAPQKTRLNVHTEGQPGSGLLN